MTIPAGNHILIQPDDTEQTTQGGIIRTTKATPNTGKVIRISEECDTSLAVGDRVQYLPNGRTEMEDGTILIKEENILFVFNESV